MTSALYCRVKTRRSNSSFFLPFLFLAPQRRSAMYALYAFCREVDDIVDSDLPKVEARFRLNAWRQELRHAFAGSAHHPVGIEVARYQPLFSLPQQPFYDILDGMEMDLAHNRYHTLEDLTLYCRKVAVAVGIVSMAIFLHDGSEKVEASADTTEPMNNHQQFAWHLGVALQLTNILRDVGEDADMGRIYLPQQLLQEHGVSEEDVLKKRWSSALAEVLRQLAEEAQHHYQQADVLISTLEERRKLRPAFMMAAIYQTYLQRLQHNQFNCFDASMTLSTPSKFWTLCRAWWHERFR